MIQKATGEQKPVWSWVQGVKYIVLPNVGRCKIIKEPSPKGGGREGRQSLSMQEVKAEKRGSAFQI